MTELMSRDANESAFMFLTELEVNSKDCRGRRPEPNIKSDGNLLLSCGWSWTGRWRQAEDSPVRLPAIFLLLFDDAGR